ncbi:membrane-bound lytic murein transglycosylase MltF [Marinicella sediminis]|uniref:Membrane-bound lytic murein transglycosylase MltF n=1 Tax=Marinicella sediminis TaxID=1792834 RepID=A0ABV7J669_9GAMM|nr:membrane-bound lytic murein transglycosylase MltF [Marinicella sediminis]
MQQLLLVLFIMLGFVMLFSPLRQTSQWELIEQRGVLKYGTRISLLSYFRVTDDVVGYEHQLLKAFCEQNNLQLEPVVFENNGAMLAALESGEIDLAGGHLSRTKSRAMSYQFSAPISETAINLVTHFDFRHETSLDAFEPARGELIGNSSYAELLDELADFSPKNLVLTNRFSLFELIKKINSKDLDYTFADAEIVDIYQYFVPGIYQTIQLSPKEDVVFMTHLYRSEELLLHLNQFIQQARKDGLLNNFRNDLMKHIPDIDVADTVTFFDKLQSVWPDIKDLVLEVAEEEGFDPALLAAISYQESHWDPDAVSISGVKGLMMLTATTAEELNIEDRTDPRQSLIGGIRYFRNMQNKIPQRIEEPDKSLFALAAYNIGYGHLEDARILAQSAGKDPDVWLDVEPFLKQLNNTAMAPMLRFGNADGRTAVIYVNNIMTYQQLMAWKLQKDRTAAHWNKPIM